MDVRIILQMRLTLVLCLLLGWSSGREVGFDGPINRAAQEWLNSLFTLPQQLRVRKEYRTLSDAERNKYHLAFQLLKNDTSVEPNKYDLLVSLHARRSTRNSAHRGPGFLGWHRVFILLVENALRQKVEGITLPYWDTALEGEMDEPHLSCLWTEDFMGRGDGNVNNGPFAHWATQAGTLYRAVGIKQWPMTHRNLSALMHRTHMSDISYPNADDNKDRTTNYEKLHNNVHNWIGGEMKSIETAGDDPVFYIYHTFVDLIWEEFRAQQRARGVDPVTDYAEFYGHARHHMFSPMGLGNLLAIDGQSDVFSTNIQYLPRPSCSLASPSCNSTYLWCHLGKERCLPWTTEELRELKRLAVNNGFSLAEQSERYKRDLYEADIAELQGATNDKPFSTLEQMHRVRNIHQHPHEESAKHSHEGHVHDPQSGRDVTGTTDKHTITGSAGFSMLMLVASVGALALLSVCSKIMSSFPRAAHSQSSPQQEVAPSTQNGGSHVNHTEQNNGGPTCDVSFHAVEHGHEEVVSRPYNNSVFLHDIESAYNNSETEKPLEQACAVSADSDFINERIALEKYKINQEGRVNVDMEVHFEGRDDVCTTDEVDSAGSSLDSLSQLQLQLELMDDDYFDSIINGIKL